MWGSPLHHSLGVSSCLPLTTGSSKLPATTPETSCCKKDSRSGFIHCPCCKLNSALQKSLKFVICHKPCHQTSSISAEVVEIKQGLEGFGLQFPEKSLIQTSRRMTDYYICCSTFSHRSISDTPANTHGFSQLWISKLRAQLRFPLSFHPSQDMITTQ